MLLLCSARTQVLHSSLKAYRPITVRLLNYRADCTPFVNDLTVMPILDRTTHATTHFLGIMREQPLPGMLAPTPHASETMNPFDAAAGVPHSGVISLATARFFATACAARATGATGDGFIGGEVGLSNLMSGVMGGGAALGGLQDSLLGQLMADIAGSPAAAAAANSASAMSGKRGHYAVPPALHVPTQLHEALQHDVPHPQLITERQPPYKTIHVNAAWCRQCGYRADDLIGRPYSMLLGPSPSPALVQILEHAFSSVRQVSPRFPAVTPS